MIAVSEVTQNSEKSINTMLSLKVNSPEATTQFSPNSCFNLSARFLSAISPVTNIV